MVSFIINHRLEELHDCPSVHIACTPSDLAAACRSSHAAQVHYPYLNNTRHRSAASRDLMTQMRRITALNLAAAGEMDCTRDEGVT